MCVGCVGRLCSGAFRPVDPGEAKQRGDKGGDIEINKGVIRNMYTASAAVTTLTTATPSVWHNLVHTLLMQSLCVCVFHVRLHSNTLRM